MGSNTLVISGVGQPGQADATLTVESFSWGVGLKQVVISSELSDFSAQIAVLQIVDDTRDATLACLDDDGNEYLSFRFSQGRIRGYTVSGSTERAQEQYTIECSSVEMTSGNQFVASDG